MLRLYSSPLMMVKPFERRIMRLASTELTGSLWCSMYARYGLVQVGSMSRTSIGSFSLPGGSAVLVDGCGGSGRWSKFDGPLRDALKEDAGWHLRLV